METAINSECNLILQIDGGPPGPKSYYIDFDTGEIKQSLPARFFTAGDEAVDDRQEAFMHRFESVTMKSKFIRKRQGFFCCACHTLTMVLTVAYVVGLIVCIVIYCLAAQQLQLVLDEPPSNDAAISASVQDWLNGNSSDFNFAATVKYTLTEAVNIIDNNVQTIGTTVDDVVGSLNATIVVRLLTIFHMNLAFKCEKLLHALINYKSSAFK